MSNFATGSGIVIACDVTSRSALESLVESTGSLSFIKGYKIGAMLALRLGLRVACNTIRRHARQPLIYDHQKFGTDIPEMCGGDILGVMSDAGISQVIAFPLAGIRTLQAFITGCRDRGLEPIVGGEMTHPGFGVSEGGYIEDDAPSRIYRDAVTMGVSRFVVPGTKPDRIARYRAELEARGARLVFMFPGIGKGQGGDIKTAFECVRPHVSFAIVGRGIYAQSDPGAAAKVLWKTATTSQT